MHRGIPKLCTLLYSESLLAFFYWLLSHLNPKIHDFRPILVEKKLLTESKVQIDLFLLWVLITYGPGIYMPNMGINCCLFCKAHIFLRIACIYRWRFLPYKERLIKFHSTYKNTLVCPTT